MMARISYIVQEYCGDNGPEFSLCRLVTVIEDGAPAYMLPAVDVAFFKDKAEAGLFREYLIGLKKG